MPGSLDLILNADFVSRRHCIVFPVRKGGRVAAVVHDLSANGTLVNDTLVGFNNMRGLGDGDEIELSPGIRFRFHSSHAESSRFDEKYSSLKQLVAGTLSTCTKCREKATGREFTSVTPNTNPWDSFSKGLSSILMGLRHPNIVDLIEIFDDPPRLIHIQEPIAARHKLFDYIIAKQKLSEHETREIFRQLFAAVKYLVSFQIALFPAFIRALWVS